MLEHEPDAGRWDRGPSATHADHRAQCSRIEKGRQVASDRAVLAWEHGKAEGRAPFNNWGGEGSHTTPPRPPCTPPPPPPRKRLSQIFFRAFGQSKFFSGAFGANRFYFRPKIFFGASENSAPPERGGGGGVGTRPWWLALLACCGAYWPLAFEPSAMTSRHPYYCGHPRCRGHPP